jgi:hypothetical protein
LRKVLHIVGCVVLHGTVEGAGAGQQGGGDGNAECQGSFDLSGFHFLFLFRFG